MSAPGSSSSTIPTAQTLVYTVTNIYNQFNFKLIVDGSKYKLWRQIFTDICKAAKVMGHITGNAKPTSNEDEEWESVNSRVKSWFYSTIDANLLQIISRDNCTTKDIWDELDKFFLNNKMSRMLKLQDQFRNTKKGTSSITEFCHTLKNLADALLDVDSKITNIELVMQILRQLPPSYHNIVDLITNTKPFASFLEAKNMLLLHEAREETLDVTLDNSTTSNAVLYLTSTNSGKSKNKWNKNRNNNRVASRGNCSLYVSTNQIAVQVNNLIL